MMPRKTKPEQGNKYYIRKASGGYSTCIQGSPKDSVSDVLANCVGFANGFLNELEGKGKEVVPLNCNAENFIERAIAYGYSVVKEPVLGGIMVWQKGATLSGNDGAGHVAGVYEEVSPTQVKTAESGYGNKAFWTATRNKGNGNWGAGTGYTYRGCIVPKYWKPEVKPEPKPEPIKELKFKFGDTVLFTGVLYGDSYGNKPGQSRNNLKAIITSINASGSKPYNINKGLGWVSENDLKLYVEPTPTPEPKPPVDKSIKNGDIVIANGRGYSSSYGKGQATRIFSNHKMKVIMIADSSRPYRYACNMYAQGTVGNAKDVTAWFKESDLRK